MIPWLSLFTATAWVDFIGMVLSKVFSFTSGLALWYDKFGAVAATLDIFIIVMGIALAKFIMPAATGFTLAGLAILIQVIHDVLFGGLITAIPKGHNQLIDVFKFYIGGDTSKNWMIVAADSLMIGSSALLMEWLDKNMSTDKIAFLGILVVYAILHILYTK